MTKVTHTNYMHPRHLRVEEAGAVLCYAPSTQLYASVNRDKLPCSICERSRSCTLCRKGIH